MNNRQILQICKNNPLKFISYLIQKIGIRVILFYLVSEGPFQEPKSVTNVKIRLIDRNELSNLPRIRKEKVYKRRFQRGDICFAAIMDNEIVGFTWVDTNMCNFASLFKLKKDEAYIYDAYILPKARRFGIAAYLRYSCYKELEKRGFKKFFSITERYNKPAIRFKEKLGARTLGSGLRIIILGKIDFVRCEYVGVKGEIKKVTV